MLFRSDNNDDEGHDANIPLVDAYRNKMRSSMMGAGQDVTTVAPHFETRVGKRRWNERIEKSKKSRREGSP